MDHCPAGVAGRLLWAVRGGQLSLQLDPRAAVQGSPSPLCSWDQRERGESGAQQPRQPFPIPCQSYSQKELASLWTGGTGCLHTWEVV